MAQTKTLCNVVQEAPDNIAHEKILFNFVVILWGNTALVKTFCNVAQKTPDKIAQEKTRAILPEQHLVTFCRFLFWTS